MTKISSGVVVIVLVAINVPAGAQQYPVKPIRVLAGGAGNAVDLSARYLGQRLSEKWGKSVIVENRGGLAHVGAAITAKALPDGYTLCMGEFSTHVSAPSLFKNLAYDPNTDFAPITMVMRAPLVLVSSPAFPAASLKELVEYAKKRPGELKYAAQSVRSAGYLTMKLFLRAAGAEMLHVPYKRAPESLTAVLSREADISFQAGPVALPLLATGRVRAYAVSSGKRFSGAPDIPTVAEQGVAGFDTFVWSAVFAPARTPPALVARLNREIGEILRSPESQAAFLAQGAEAAPGTSLALADFVKTEGVKWARVIKEAGITAE